MLTWSRILILSLFHSIALGQQNIDDMINDVFGKQNTSTLSEQNINDSIIDVFGKQNTSTLGQQNIDDAILEVFGKKNTSTTDSDNCTCVYFYLCKNGTIIRNGRGIIDIRISTNPCENNLEVCCSLEDVTEIRIPPKPILKFPTGCGFRNREGVNFKITGDTDNEAQFGEFPWMVAILRENTNVYQCGGALIHPQVVLTAAHCVSDSSKRFKIRAGEWDSQHTAEPYPHQDRGVQSVTRHPEYNSGALYNDVAVLVLNSPVEIAENIGIACLPSQEDIIRSGRCFATGWGKDVFGKKGKYQVIMKKIDLPIVPNPQCQANLRTTRLGKYFELHPSFICAGGEPGKDTCKGDGGSPLVCSIPESPDRYFQAGIVAWGIGCGENQIPGVYANVAKFRYWIDEQMNSLGFDKSSYQY